MFIGHYGLGFAAKKATPSVSLGALFLASQFADLLWPTLLLLGLERVAIEPGVTVVTPFNFISYPYSHSLLTLCIWGVLFGVIYAAATRSRAIVAITLALLVVSHWFLDFVTHRPDLPLTPFGDDRYGLNLWSSLPATLAVEFTIFSIGVWLYARTTTARDRIGSIGLWALVGFLTVVMIGNIYGPPPPSEVAVAWAGHALWLLVIWGGWIDRHRYPSTLR